jgi:hypothetical protein
MKRVQSRAELKHKMLLTMGHPYIRVDLSDEHLDMAVDGALRIFFKYSPYGSFESHYAYTMTALDITNGYIPIPRYIDSVVEVLGKGMSISDLSFMTMEYQMTRETFMAAQKFNNVALVDYVTLQQRLYNTQQIIQQPKSFTFVRYQRRLIPYFALSEGQIVVFRCYENVDPEAADVGMDPLSVIPSADLWDDETLLCLAVSEAKMTWGSILKKFGNVVLPGGVTLSGDAIYREGKTESDVIIAGYLSASPIDFFMG